MNFVQIDDRYSGRVSISYEADGRQYPAAGFSTGNSEKAIKYNKFFSREEGNYRFHAVLEDGKMEGGGTCHRDR